MADPLLTDDELRAILLSPAEAASGNKRVRQHPVGDAIEAIKYVESKDTTRRRRTFRSIPQSPPGTQ